MARSAEEIRAALEAPFSDNEIKYRQGSFGKSLAYLDGPTVYRRLNASCNSWDFVISKSEFTGMSDRDGEIKKVMIVEGHLSIPELGTRAGTGVQIISPGSGEDIFKGARTDAIKNAASLFGVGLHLYSDSTTDMNEGGQMQQPRQHNGGYGGYGGGYRPQQQAPQQQAPQQYQRQVQSGWDQSPGRGEPASDGQMRFVNSLVTEHDLNRDEVFRRYGVQGGQPTKAQAYRIIEDLKNMPKPANSAGAGSPVQQQIRQEMYNEDPIAHESMDNMNNVPF